MGYIGVIHNSCQAYNFFLHTNRVGIKERSMENTESKHFHHESYCRKCDTPRTDALMEGGCIATNILEHARELEREVNSTNERMVEIKQKQTSLIAAVNYAINEYGGSTASIYLARIMENLFSK